MEMNIAVCDDQPEVLDVVENMLRLLETLLLMLHFPAIFSKNFQLQY